MSARTELICNVWQAWARFTRISWEIVSQYDKRELTTHQYKKLVAENQECAEARIAMIGYDYECDKRGIDWLNSSSSSQAACAARREHLTYSRMIWDHLSH